MKRHCLYAVRALAIAFCLLATPALADVTSPAIDHPGRTGHVGQRWGGYQAEYQCAGQAVDGKVGDHCRRTKLTAASASEAIMSGRARWTARTVTSI